MCPAWYQQSVPNLAVQVFDEECRLLRLVTAVQQSQTQQMSSTQLPFTQNLGANYSD